MKYRYILLCTIAAIVVLAACSELGGTPGQPLDSPLADAMTSPLAAPEQLAVNISETSGAVRGAIIGRTVQGEYRPVAGYIVGLAELVPANDGSGAIAAAYDPYNAPTTKTDEQGRFAFNNIEPGEYGLILDAVKNQALLSFPEKGGSILMTVEPGEIVELDTLRYESLPIFGFAN